MFKYNYQSLENKINNQNIIKLLGKINIDVLKSIENEEFAFYTLPLIERLVVELYKLLPLKDIEVDDQGTMRTVISIIDSDNDKYLPDNVINMLKEIYGEDGVRNKLLHVHDDDGNITLNIPIEKILYLIDFLLGIIIDKYDEYDNLEFGHIERIQ